MLIQYDTRFTWYNRDLALVDLFLASTEHDLLLNLDNEGDKYD